MLGTANRFPSSRFSAANIGSAQTFSAGNLAFHSLFRSRVTSLDQQSGVAGDLAAAESQLQTAVKTDPQFIAMKNHENPVVRKLVEAGQAVMRSRFAAGFTMAQTAIFGFFRGR